MVCFQPLRIQGTNLWLHSDIETPQSGVLSFLLFNAAIKVLQRKDEKMQKLMAVCLGIKKLYLADNLRLVDAKAKYASQLVRCEVESSGEVDLKIDHNKS